MSKLRTFRRELRGCIGRVVGYQIRDGYGASIAPVLERVMRAERVRDVEVFDALATEDGDDFSAVEEQARQLATPVIVPAGRGGRATALVSCRGVALYEAEFQPYCFSTQLLAQTVTALANDPEIGTVVLVFDSPGGVVTGVPEAGDAIFAARKNADIVALVNPLCASAAYWLASQASEIVAVPSADIGSVGVFVLHAECSGMLEQMGVKPKFIFAKDSPYKVEGNSLEPLSPEAEEYIQTEVDAWMAAFVRAIARGRGVSRSKVLADFGKGRTMSASEARTAGMIDRVAPLAQALTRWGVSGTALERRRRGEAEEPALAISWDAAQASCDALAEQLDEPVGTDLEVGVIIFRTELAADGQRLNYVEEPWPAASTFSDAFWQPDEEGGNRMTLEAENGRAVYETVIRTDETVTARRVFSEFAPPPPSAEVAAAVADSDRRRRRLAQLRRA